MTPKSKGMEYVRCNLCGANDCEIIYPGATSAEGGPLTERYSASSYHIGNDQVVRCRKCGLVYVNPRTASKLIIKGYSEAVDERYVSQGKGRTATFEAGMDLIERHASKKGRLLDVGCAAGFFLNVAKKRGWETYGVEPGRWLADWGNKKFGLKIKPCTLRKARFPSNYFDVVTMWDVLEHVPDPKGELREAYRVLKKGGLLVVNFPNIGSKLARLAGRKWWFLLSVHLYYFTPKTLKQMLEKTGFDNFLVKRHWQKLSLGYLIFRTKPYSPLLYNILSPISKALRLDEKQIPYYASQAVTLSHKV